jgi:hypothetical protein
MIRVRFLNFLTAVRYEQLLNSPAIERTKFFTYCRTFNGNIAGEFYQLKIDISGQVADKFCGYSE